MGSAARSRSTCRALIWWAIIQTKCSIAAASSGTAAATSSRREPQPWSGDCHYFSRTLTDESLRQPSAAPTATAEDKHSSRQIRMLTAPAVVNKYPDS